MERGHEEEETQESSRRGAWQARWLMLIGLFQQNTTGSVAECRGRFFRKPCKNSSRSLPVKTPAESTWAPVAGRMGSYVRDASTGGPIG